MSEANFFFPWKRNLPPSHLTDLTEIETNELKASLLSYSVSYKIRVLKDNKRLKDVEEVVRSKSIYFWPDNLSMEDVASKASKILDDQIAAILNHDPLAMQVPTLVRDRAHFCKELQCLLLKNDEYKLCFCDNTTAGKYTNAIYCIFKILQLCSHTSRRNLFYSVSNIPLIDHHVDLDEAVWKASIILKCRVRNIPIDVVDTGRVIGHLFYRYKCQGGSTLDINCMFVEEEGRTIPPIHKVDAKSIATKHALFILVVEKRTVFLELVADRFYEKYPCIIVCSGGYPTIFTRLFLSKISKKLLLPVFALMDGDIDGFRIYSVYKYGSKDFASESRKLVLPHIELLGILPDDWKKYEVPVCFTKEMSDAEVKVVDSMFVTYKEQGRDQRDCDLLTSIITNKRKVEISALNSTQLQYLSRIFLPHKLKEFASNNQQSSSDFVTSPITPPETPERSSLEEGSVAGMIVADVPPRSPGRLAAEEPAASLNDLAEEINIDLPEEIKCVKCQECSGYGVLENEDCFMCYNPYCKHTELVSEYRRRTNMET